MVTEAGKELLRNTINTAKFHNRILEENEMWKQWELECGLTMMVSDDDILKKIKKQHQCSKHRKRGKSREHERYKRKDEPKASTSREDRWDHSGFHELYPNESEDERSITSDTEAKRKKWDHSGFYELYPAETPVEQLMPSISDTKIKPKKHKKQKRKHCSESTSDDEIWEDFKKFKKNEKEKNKLKLQLLKCSSNFDSHVKEWKKCGKETATKSTKR